VEYSPYRLGSFVTATVPLLLRVCYGSDLNFAPILPGCYGCYGSKGGEGGYIMFLYSMYPYPQRATVNPLLHSTENSEEPLTGKTTPGCHPSIRQSTNPPVPLSCITPSLHHSSPGESNQVQPNPTKSNRLPLCWLVHWNSRDVSFPSKLHCLLLPNHLNIPPLHGRKASDRCLDFRLPN
jgi:hypothetical protein